MAYCAFKWTHVGTQKWWSQLFVHAFTITYIKKGLIYQGSYTENLKIKQYFENFVIVKACTKSCDHLFVVPL